MTDKALGVTKQVFKLIFFMEWIKKMDKALLGWYKESRASTAFTCVWCHT